METRELPVAAIIAPPWNPNTVDAAALARLRASIKRFGLVVPQVDLAIGSDRDETVGGAERLQVLRDLGRETSPCVVVGFDANDTRILAQALNRIAG